MLYNCTKAYKNKRYKGKRGARIILNQALDNVRNPSEACLPPSRPSLISYALKTRGALRMIRVSTFSNDFYLREGAKVSLYNPEGLT
jgi:hypothetical protein